MTDDNAAPALPQSEIASAKIFWDDPQHWRIRVGALCRERDELRARIEQLEEENAPAPDIAGLIGRLEKLGPDGGLWKDAAAALRKLAAEVAWWKAKIDEVRATGNAHAEENVWCKQRIRELEAERDKALNELDGIAKALDMQDTDEDMRERILWLVGEGRTIRQELRDAIRRKTVDIACQAVKDILPPGGLLVACERRIRALADPESDK